MLVAPSPGQASPVARKSAELFGKQHFANVYRGTTLAVDQMPVLPHGRSAAEWLLANRMGSGVRICLIDSGVEYAHHQIDNAGTSYAAAVNAEGQPQIIEAEALDVVGHGTACASIISRVAPAAQLDSVRVLGPKNRGSSAAFLAALEWAISMEYDIVNLSLSTRRTELRPKLLELTENAISSGVLLVCSAHNSPVQSYPWALSSVVSVGSHDHPDAYEVQMNPDPPVEFYAGGVEVRVAWLQGSMRIMSGNSFATPAIAANLARIKEGYPRLQTWQYKYLLSLLATNIRWHTDG